MKKSKREHFGFSNAPLPVKVAVTEGKNVGRVTHFAHHSELEIQLFLAGRGRYFIRDKTYHGEKNTILIIHQDEIHKYIPYPDSSVTKYSLMFGKQIKAESHLTSELVADLSCTYAVSINDREAIECRHLMDEISKEQQHRGAFWETVVRDNIKKILIILRRAQKHDTRDAAVDNELVEKVISYIRENYDYKLTLHEMAEFLGFSPFHISRYFKRYTGLGFKEYLIQFRISKAKSLLLKRKNWTVSAVAHKVGFGEISSFNHQFKKLTNYTPSDYRKTFTEENEYHKKT